MYSVTKTFRVPVGHRLSKHKGLCKNIHGHNLKIEVRIKSEDLNDNDMVIDFSDLKNIVNGFLEDWDHTLLLNSRDELADYAQKNSKTFFVAGEPTAENLSKYLYERIQSALNLNAKNLDSYSNELNLNVDFVRIWENDDSYAEYTKEYDEEE